MAAAAAAAGLGEAFPHLRHLYHIPDRLCSCSDRKIGGRMPGLLLTAASALESQSAGLRAALNSAPR